MCRERITWIDQLKNIGLGLVVVGHFLRGGSIKAFIYSFHVPLFFILAGYLNELVHQGEHRIRIRRLLLPYLVWTAISLIVSSATSPESVQVDLIVQSFVPLSGFCCWNRPLWFLYALFFAEIITPSVREVARCLQGSRKELLRVAAFLLAFAALFVADLLTGRNFLCYRQIFLGSLFYLLGGMLCKYDVIARLGTRKWLPPLLILIGLTCVHFNGKLSIWAWRIKFLSLLLISASALCLAWMMLMQKVTARLGRLGVLLLSGGEGNVFMLCSHYFIYVYGWSALAPKELRRNVFLAITGGLIVIALYRITWCLFQKMRNVNWCKHKRSENRT